MGVAELGFDQSAEQLRELLRRQLVKMTDLRDDPQWFFEAHRVIACHGMDLGMGFWTRFTVQFNLFAGTILAVGNDSQVNQLVGMQERCELGCFGLTEKFAGVSSGMVVETIAEFDPATQEFIITSPNEGAYKNWISQGFCADKSVVMADLHLGGRSYGPHAFLFDFRVECNGKKELVKGVRLADMGRKTVANDLDNAWIAFDGVRVPHAALLDRYAGVDAKGNYVEKAKGMHTMQMIGQRLFTGRVAVAQAATLFGKTLFAHTREYTDNKLCWAPKGMRPPLSLLPQMSSLFDEAEEAFAYATRYTSMVEAELCACLHAGRMPSANLTEAIATAKIRAVETTIQLCFRLKQTVGSHALMYGSGFEQTDSMQIAKFAEGESFVLMQKLARDRVKNLVPVAGTPSEEEQAVYSELQGAKGAEWIEKTSKVYLLAELVMDRTMQQMTGDPLPKGIARPFARL
jgi:alkylation response protein AidB-like acyl-CoA dehydrogenase